MNDLSNGGKNEIIDLKKLVLYPKRITKAQWKDIRTAVIRDLEIGLKNDVFLQSGSTGLDAWNIVLSKKSKKVEVFITDIGTSSGFSDTLSSKSEVLERAKQRVNFSLDHIENRLIAENCFRK